MKDLYGRPIETIEFRMAEEGQRNYTPHHPWPEETHVSAGQGVVIARKSEDSYTTLFMEVYPPEASFIRGEGPTQEACEDACWDQYQRALHCTNGRSHEWESRGYKNGAGFCKHCGTFKPEAFTAEELGQLCHECGEPTMWSWVEVDGQTIFGCEKHNVERPYDQLSPIEQLFDAMKRGKE